MINILYEDNHIIVCVKPKGVLSQKDSSSKEDMLTILKKYIKEKYNKPGDVYLGLVHRLDINTSGVMVFARTSKAAKRLNEQINNHDFEKRYIATVEGIMNPSETKTISIKLEKNESERKAYVSSSGKEAVLEYNVIKNYEINNVKVTDVEILLKTGRFHQIRATFAYLNHPLYGDKKYGSKVSINELDFPLEAYSLTFTHPVTKERLCFKSKNI